MGAGRFRQGLGAALAVCLLAALVGAGPSSAQRLIDIGLPNLHTGLNFARQLQLDLSDVPRCRWAPVQSYPAFDWSSCEPAVVASGRIRWEVAFPEQEAFRVGDEATAYRGKRNRLLIRSYVPAPVSGEVVIPVELSPISEGIYDLRATAAIPKLADGYGSLTYLGLRFRKGLFSAACPKRRLQSRVTDTFADGTRIAGGLITTY